MNILIHMLLGLFLGSFFYGIVTNFERNIFCKKGIISIALSVLTMTITAFAVGNNTLFQNIIVYSVIITLCYESISDIEIMHTFTPVIMVCTLVILIIRLWQWYNAGAEFLIWQIAVVILVKSACISLAFIARNFIGEGDLDIYFLLYLAYPMYGLMLLIFTSIIFIKNSMLILKREGTRIQTIMYKRIPFVPFLLLGFVLAILI